MFYATQLQKLAEAVRGKRLRRLSLHLLQDNARPYLAKAIHQKIEELDWKPYLIRHILLKWLSQIATLFAS